MMLFTDAETDDTPPVPAPAPGYGEDEARERAYDIVETIIAAMVGPARAWERIEALAEELRLIARAAPILDAAPTARETTT
jgi:hypothetical protein